MTTETGALIRIGLYLALFWPVVGWAIYIDAKRNNIAKPRFLAVAYGFFGPIGGMVYWNRYKTSKKSSWPKVRTCSE